MGIAMQIQANNPKERPTFDSSKNIWHDGRQNTTLTMFRMGSLHKHQFKKKERIRSVVGWLFIVITAQKMRGTSKLTWCKYPQLRT